MHDKYYELLEGRHMAKAVSQKRITTTLPLDWRRRLDEHCEDKGVKASEVIREGIKLYFKAHNIKFTDLSEPEGPGRRWE